MVMSLIPGRRTMGRLVLGCVTRYVSSHPGQLNLLPSVGREVITGQSAVMGLKAGWFIQFVDKSVGGR